MNISASLLLKYTKPILHQTPNSPRNHIKPLPLKLRLMYRTQKRLTFQFTSQSQFFTGQRDCV